MVALRSSPSLIVFDPYPGGCFTPEPLSECASTLPSCVVFAYGRFPPASAPEVVELCHLGVHGVAVRDADDAPQKLGRLLNTALRHGFLSRARAILEPAWPPHLTGVLGQILAHADRDLKPAEVGRLCHQHPKTTRALLREAGLPSLEKLIVWMRLIHASRLLLDPARSVENVALTLEFPSVNSFRNQLLRYAGIAPTTLRAIGDQDFLARAAAASFCGNVTAADRFSAV